MGVRYPLRPYIRMAKREEWGAASPRKRPQPLKLPVGTIMLFDTQTPECTTAGECKQAVKRLQGFYMYEKGYEDIPWSFLIGSDERVYEGRGWKVKPLKIDLENPTQAQWDGRSIDVAFIGDYRCKLPGQIPSNQTINLIRLLREMKGVEPKQLQMHSFLLKRD